MTTAYLALLIICQSLGEKFLDDFLWGIVFLNFPVKVETYHVASINLARELEEFGKALLLGLLKVLGCHCDDKVHVDIVMMFLVILILSLSVAILERQNRWVVL